MILRYRLPHHEYVLIELEEDGYVSSAAFLRQLIDFQEDLREQHGPDSIVCTRPRLMTCNETIDFLRQGLVVAEEAHYAGWLTSL